jgi:Holliday junction resolvase
MAINSYNKGANSERELSKFIMKYTNYTCRRGCQNTAENTPDIIIDQCPEIFIECKHLKDPLTYEALFKIYEYAVVQSSKKLKPDKIIICHRSNRKPWLMTTMEDGILYTTDLKNYLKIKGRL